MKLGERIIEAMKEPICDNCLGRTIGNLLSGMTNLERGKVARLYAAFLIDSGERLNIHMPNLHGFKFRSFKGSTEGPTKCDICSGFFPEGVEMWARKAAGKAEGYEFSSFVVGSAPTDDMLNREEELWNRTGIDYVEPIKSEINREVGKKLEKLLGKKFDMKDPDIVFFLDMKKGEVRIQVKSLFILGEYQKLVRGIPQTRWMCAGCGGKGCVECKGEGKKYKTSVQEIIGKPICAQAGGKDHIFHGSGREDIDARCLGWRPFVLEVLKPRKRKIDLKKAERQIAKSGKVKVRKLSFSDKKTVRKIKSDRHDKTYFASVEFEQKIDKKLLPSLRSLKGRSISQQTPSRVVHRRADLTRKRSVLEISYKQKGPRSLDVTIKGNAGLYIKELISGDGGRTKPSVAELLNNKVKRIVLDVIKIHPVK
jgi:tRNA pseudouridine synthase 10